MNLLECFFDIDHQSLNCKMEDINRELNDNMHALSVDYSCNFAFGMTVFPEECQTAPELMKIADKRMYDQKMKMKGEVR
jgi:GGDEF domain-containing protein